MRPQILLNADPSYFGNISQLLQQRAREKLPGYLEASIIFQCADHVHKDFTRPAKAQSRSASGVPADAVPEQCYTRVEEVDIMMCLALGSAFQQRAGETSKKKHVSSMTKIIMQNFLQGASQPGRMAS